MSSKKFHDTNLREKILAKKIFMKDKQFLWKTNNFMMKHFLWQKLCDKKVKWQKKSSDKKFSWQKIFYDKKFLWQKNFSWQKVFMTKLSTKIFITINFITKTFSWQKVFWQKVYQESIAPVGVNTAAKFRCASILERHFLHLL